MNKIINNLHKQISELNKQDDRLRDEGLGWMFLDRENIRACMLDIKKVIKTLETIK